jgi:hypothetical protein
MMRFLGWVFAAWVGFCVLIGVARNDSVRTPATSLVTGSVNLPSEQSNEPPRLSVWEDMKRDAISRLKIKNFRWTKGGFGSVLVLDSLTIFNGSRYKVSDLQIKCSLQAESGTVLSEPTKILYVSIPPNKSKTLSDVNVGFINDQAQSGSCWIADVADVSLIE